MLDPADMAVKILRTGGTVIYPTETVYGIGANALDETCINKVFRAKRRPSGMPLTLAVSSFEMLEDTARISYEDMALMKKILPGPVTFLVRRRSIVPSLLTAGSPLVGIRFPDHEIALKLIDGTGPITSTSANISGSPPPVDYSEIDPAVAESVDLVMDGGRCRYAEPSTLVDLEKRAVLRKGAWFVKVADILR